MLEVEGQAGNQHAAKHSAPGLWALPARLGRAAWPQLLRGDGDWGTEANMSRAEREGLAYVTSTHGRAGRVRRMLAEVVAFFKSLRPIAEQLSDLQRWYRILSRALVKYLKGRQLRPPPIPLPA